MVLYKSCAEKAKRSVSTDTCVTVTKIVNNSSSYIMWDEALYDDPLFTEVKSNANEVNYLNPCNNENSTKKQKLQPTILTSPDLSMLEFNYPELEYFDLPQQATTDHIITTPTPSLTSMSVAVEQDMYAHPFNETLEFLNHNDNQLKIQMTSTGINSSEYQYEPQYSVLMTSNYFSNITPLDVITKEPHTVPSAKASSPISMSSQEKIKLEEKRRKNRVASSKCRQKKLEQKAKLGYNINVLKNENTELTTEFNRLSEQICQLKQTVVEHMHYGCKFPVNYCDLQLEVYQLIY